MPNPPKKKGSGRSRKQHQKARREQELEEQRRVLYDEASAKGAKETAAIQKNILNLNYGIKAKQDGKEHSLSEIFMRATASGMSHTDPKASAAHCRNFLTMYHCLLKEKELEHNIANAENMNTSMNLHLHEAAPAEYLQEIQLRLQAGKEFVHDDPSYSRKRTEHPEHDEDPTPDA